MFISCVTLRSVEIHGLWDIWWKKVCTWTVGVTLAEISLMHIVHKRTLDESIHDCTSALWLYFFSSSCDEPTAKHVHHTDRFRYSSQFKRYKSWTVVRAAAQCCSYGVLLFVRVIKRVHIVWYIAPICIYCTCFTRAAVVTCFCTGYYKLWRTL